MSRFAVIGSPVAHSKSPLMHAAAYRALGMSHVYEKVETPAEELAERVEALRRGDFDGLNVTVPHKTRVLSLVDEVDPSARATWAANTLVRTAERRIRALNTDTPALAEELARLAGGRDALRGRSAVVVGTGGAARAAIVALAAHLGIRRVIVRGRALGDRSHAVAYVREVDRMLAAAGGTAASVAVGAEGIVPTHPEDPELAAIVQATTCGMQGGPPGDVAANAVRWDSVPSSAVALDVVYVPRDTPFLDAARAHGIACDDGLGMLARQGALAFEAWLGVAPPLDVMIAALR